MPKFYLAESADTSKLAEGSLDGLKALLRAAQPYRDWDVKVYDFNFTKENICKFIMGDIKPGETFVLQVNPNGQCRRRP